MGQKEIFSKIKKLKQSTGREKTVGIPHLKRPREKELEVQLRYSKLVVNGVQSTKLRLTFKVRGEKYEKWR